MWCAQFLILGNVFWFLPFPKKDLTCVTFTGHEREDVVKYRQEVFLPLLEKIMQRSFMVDPQHPENEPVLHPDMEDRIESEPYIPDDPYDIDASNVIHVVLVHDECAFNANDDQRSFWGQEDQQVRRDVDSRSFAEKVTGGGGGGSQPFLLNILLLADQKQVGW